MHLFSREHVVTALIVLAAIMGASGIALSWKYYEAGLPHKETFAKAYGLTLQTYDGKEVRLTDFRNKLVVAYAFASWCPYCGAEIENLAKLKTTYGDKIQILAINRAEPLSVAKAYTSELQGTDGILFLLDPTDAFFKQIGGYAMPETVFIGKNGEVTFHQHGPMQLPAVEDKLKQLLGQ